MVLRLRNRALCSKVATRTIQKQARGRIKEMLALFLKKDSGRMKYFQRSLQLDIQLQKAEDVCHQESLDVCTVCLAELHGYEDYSCVKCENSAICWLCVQKFDPRNLVPLCPKENLQRFRMNYESGEYDLSPLQAGDSICLQCGLYSPTKQQMQVYDWFNSACNLHDVLFSRKYPYGLLRLAFSGWQLLRSKNHVLLSDGCLAGAPHVVSFLTLAEEALLVAAGRNWKFITVTDSCTSSSAATSMRTSYLLQCDTETSTSAMIGSSA